ncbi:MAG: type II toxin-antitoxin system MqsA family antitoxin [Desulfosalsimonas sp.]|uniref:type II toxin-antitoxin system MqsA family antitoxin n=1 Tax=Desulfosalsimonas sp. TaxID=3073848 RepID=UPI0039708363
MKCVICKNGMTQKSFTTVVLERNQMTLVFKQVPADICENCGEEYISSATNEKLLNYAEAEYEKGVSLEMLNFAA